MKGAVVILICFATLAYKYADADPWLAYGYSGYDQGLYRPYGYRSYYGGYPYRSYGYAGYGYPYYG